MVSEFIWFMELELSEMLIMKTLEFTYTKYLWLFKNKLFDRQIQNCFAKPKNIVEFMNIIFSH